MVLTLGITVWGLTGDCPFKPEGDESLAVAAALNMVHRGTLNPHYLGHPASTIIYPLCLYYHFLNATVFHGAISDPYFSAENMMFDNVFLLCFLPRLINVFMLVLVIPVLYKIGKEVFGRNAALMGIWMFPISEILLVWGQVLRADVSAVFYSMLAMYFCIRLYLDPRHKYNLLATVFIGLAIGSRWPSLALFSVYLVTSAKLFWERRKDTDKKYEIINLTLIGLVVAFGTFALTTPYAFIDTKTLLHDLTEEKAAHGLGCDGLSPYGNFMYYINDAIPRLFYQPQSALAAAGIAIGLWKRNFLSNVLAVYTLAILTGTSLHVFHTDKWLLPILPVLALFGGQTLAFLGRYLNDILWTRMKAKTAQVWCAIIAVGVISYVEYRPFIDVCKHNTIKMFHSTDETFYKWIFANIPYGTPICFIGVWDGGHSDRYKVEDVLWDPSYFDVKCNGKYQSPYELYDKGFKYFIWNSFHCPLYLAEPDHYPRECKFFKEIFDNTELVKEVTPKSLRVYNLFEIQQPGPTFRLYKFVPKVKRQE